MTRRSSALVLGVVLALPAGCAHVTQQVPAASWEIARSGDRTRELILRAQGGKAVRLGVASRVRFRLRDGSFTPWFSGDQIRVRRGGIAFDDRVDQVVPDAARVVGLESRWAALLEEVAARQGSEARRVGSDAVALDPTASSSLDVLRRFVSELAMRLPEDSQHEYDASLCIDRSSPGGSMKRKRFPDEGPGDASRTDGSGHTSGICPPSAVGRERRALAYLRYGLKGAPLGRWYFVLKGHAEQRPIEGEELFALLDDGLYGSSGFAWRDIDTSEVENVSGSRSFGLLVAYATLPISWIPLKAMDDGKAGRASTPEPLGDPYWAEGRAADDRAVPLFASSLGWRARARPVLSLDGGSDLVRHDEGSGGATLSVRIREVFEVGLGLRVLAAPMLPPNAVEYRTLARVGGYLRLAGHYDLDAARRVAMLAGFDVGGVEDYGATFKVLLGVRLRATEHLFFGVYPFNPMFSQQETRTTNKGILFPTTVEVGWAF